jgi:RecA-family ATPase
MSTIKPHRISYTWQTARFSDGESYTLPQEDDVQCYRDTPPPAPHWVIQGLEAGDVGILSAPGGMGKSMACLSIASGQWAVSEPGDVTYLYAEDSPRVMHQRWHALAQMAEKGLPNAVAHRLHFIGLRGHPPKLMTRGEPSNQVTINTPVLTAIAETLAAQSHPRLLIIDPMVKFHSLDENDNGQMSQFIDLMATVGQQCGVAAILTHHKAKGAATGSQGAVRGAGAIVNEARWLVSLRPLPASQARALDIADEDVWRYLLASAPKVNSTAKLPDLLLERGAQSGSCG